MHTISNHLHSIAENDPAVVLENQHAVTNSDFDLSAILHLGHCGFIATAKGEDVDFVSRFFAPSAGIDEDPVTGSAHSQLIPFWSYKLGKKIMQARQLSKRGGTVYCEDRGDRVIMGGQCVFYMKGEITT